MRLLFSSNAPWTQTGYGVQTKHIIRAIRDLGYPVACLAWFGLNGGEIEWEGIPCYPRHMDAYGNDATFYAVRRFKADVLFTLIDLWVMDPHLGKYGATWCPMLPVDHDPVPPLVRERFPHAHRLIVYSRHAKTLLDSMGIASQYIPHGVDCNAFLPCTPQEKAEFRRELFKDWPEDAFVVGMVAANKGYPCRKSFFECMEAFASLLRQCPEARLYLHSWSGSEFGGPNLLEMAKHYGIQDHTRTMNPHLYLSGGYDDERMRKIYCSMDVFLNPAMGEGFGVPIVEAQACGIPAITTKFSSMTELTASGWCIPWEMSDRITTLQWSYQVRPKPEWILHYLETARSQLPNVYESAKARELAVQYHWGNVIPKFWAPFLAELDGGRMAASLELLDMGCQKV